MGPVLLGLHPDMLPISGFIHHYDASFHLLGVALKLKFIREVPVRLH